MFVATLTQKDLTVLTFYLSQSVSAFITFNLLLKQTFEFAILCRCLLFSNQCVQTSRTSLYPWESSSHSRSRSAHRRTDKKQQNSKILMFIRKFLTLKEKILTFNGKILM